MKQQEINHPEQNIVTSLDRNRSVLVLERELDDHDFSTEKEEYDDSREHFADLEEAQTSGCHDLFSYDNE